MNYNLPQNLGRRIKRLAWGREHDFFAVCAPGLEELCAHELAGLGVGPCQMERGGLAFSGRLNLAYELHLHSRLLSRVLLRLKNFRIRNLPDFINKLESIPWEIYLSSQAVIRIKSDLGQTHLQHAPSLEKHLRAAIGNSFCKHGLDAPEFGPDGQVRILLRTHDSRCTISLDLTGPHLHKRGYRKFTGPAPLRETLAAGLLAWCGYQGQLPFLDPMCGAATLPLEAAQIALRMAPGMNRSFSLNLLPCHRPATWRHMLQQAENEKLRALPNPIIAQDKASLALARQNARGLLLEDLLSWHRADFWHSPPPVNSGLLLINPPYGVRLGSVRKAAELTRRLAAHIAANYRGWQVGLLLYRPEWGAFFKFDNSKSMVISHGGLRLTMLYGRQK